MLVVLAALIAVGLVPLKVTAAAADDGIGPGVVGAATPTTAGASAAAAYQPAIALPPDQVDSAGGQLVAALRTSLAGLVDGTRPTDGPAGAAVLEAADRLAQYLLGRSGPPAEEDRAQALAALFEGSQILARTAIADAEAALRPAELEGVTWDSRQAALRSLDQARQHHAIGAAEKGNTHTAVNHFQNTWEKLALVFSGLGLTVDGDRDGDGLTDLVERILGSSPLADDSDDDGLTDLFEGDRLLTFSSAATADTDGDGLRDDQEDLDGDGLSALQEQRFGTLPTDPDTDHDSLSDKAELDQGTDPNRADTDGDSLKDAVEPRLGTSPTKADTDEDGVRDDAETNTGVTDGPDGSQVAVIGEGDVVTGVTITRAVGPRSAGVTGMVGVSYEFHADTEVRSRMDSARITLPVDPNVVAAERVRVFTYDQQLGLWAPTGRDLEVSADGTRASVTVEHFSLYAIFDIVNWGQVWSAETQCSPRDPGSGDPGTPGDVVLLDLALVLDSSGSMSWNDPQGLRRSAAKSFVDSLLPQDRAAVIDFDFGARVLQGLTTDKAAVKAAIDRVDDSGGTDIGAGVRAALGELDRAPQPGHARMAIILTDGDGAYDPALTARAKASQITLYTIGLGSAVSSSLLQQIATETGGQYYAVASADQLPQVFRRISEQTGGDPEVTKDTDGDGLTDCTERAIHAADGSTYTSDPTKKDTDGDGVPDGDEVGSRTGAPVGAPTGATGELYPVHADPALADTDGDGFDDGNELDLGTQVWAADTDGDGLSDGQELDEGTDPFDGNTDGDSDGDAYEAAHKDDGISPIVYDEKVSKWTYVAKAAQGAVFGDLWPDDSIAWLAGAVLSSLVPFIDVRDVIGSAIHADWVGAGFSIAGLIPVVGDAVGVAGKVGKFVVNNPRLAQQAAELVAKIDNLPSPARIEAVKATLKSGTWDDLVDAGFSEDALLRLARSSRNNLDELAAAVKRSGHVAGAKGVFSTGWRAGETWLENLYGATAKGVDRQVWLPTKDYGIGWGRYVDVLPADRVAHETKTGYIRVTDRIRTQISKDVALRSNGDTAGAHWHFLASGKTNTIGADKEVFDLLEEAGIPYTVHMP